MNRVLRAAVTCLLLVALPLQGYAAGTMLFCDTGAATSGTIEHHHDAAASPDGHAAHQTDATAAADNGDAPNLHDVMHGGCSACSSCCNPAALLSPSIAATSATPRATPLHDLEHANPGHGPARLERPPR